MGSHPIENIMATTMENIRNMVDVNTIVGDTVVMGDGTVIIPISKVSFGFVAGGGEYGPQASGQGQKDKGEQQGQARVSEFPFAGGTGAGVCISPMAFLVVSDGEVNMLPIQFNSSYERILSRVPEVFSQIKDLFTAQSGKEDSERGEAPHAGSAKDRGSWFSRNRRGKFDEEDAVDNDYRPPKDEL